MADEKTLVLGIFPDEVAADDAAAKLKSWDKMDDDVKLYAIGVLTKDPTTGTIKTEKMGARRWGKGAGIGLVLGAVAAIPTGGLSLAALGGGALAGGAAGSFVRKGLGMSDADVQRLDSELEAKHAAVGVLVAPSEQKPVSDRIVELGGTIETHPVATDQSQMIAQASERDES